MNKAGKLTTVKAVMSAKCVHTIISLKVPDWVFQEIDKRQCGFLWAGKDKAHGGQCQVAWTTACRPQEFGGLGIPDLRLQAYALRLRWLWMQRSDTNRPWKSLELSFGNDNIVEQIFRASIVIQLGDGNLARFWSDKWNGDFSPCILAPDLCTLVRPGIRKSRTVAIAMQGKRWITDITGQLSICTILQYFELWAAMARVHLTQGREDTISWKWTVTGTYTARSAYSAFFEGSTWFAGARPIWKAWAPLKVKFFMWLAVRSRLWMADRRHRHGLQNPTPCPLCCQVLESADHLFCSCTFTQQVWQALGNTIGLSLLVPAAEEPTISWWLRLRGGLNKLQRKGLDSTFMLVSWLIWKERNARVFNSRPPSQVHQLVDKLTEEGRAWIQGGAAKMVCVGWPTVSSSAV
ncbi:unnamed protein product [Urochloa humidicola]